MKTSSDTQATPRQAGSLKTVLKWQWQFHPLAFAAGLAISFIPAVAALVLLGVAGWFITATAIAGAAAVAINVFTPSAVIRGLALARTGGRYAERIVTHDATFRFLTDLRCRIFEGQAASAGDGRVWRSAGLLGRLTADITALDGVYLRLAVPLVVALGVGGGVIAFCAWLAPAVALGPLLALVLCAAITGHLIRHRKDKAGRLQEAAQEAVRVRTVDLVAGRRDLSIYGGLSDRVDSILAANDRLGTADMKLHRKSAGATAWSSFAAQLGVAVTLGLACWQVAQGQLTLPLAVAVVLVVLGMPDVLNALVNGFTRVGTMSRAARRAVAGTESRTRRSEGRIPSSTITDEDLAQRHAGEAALSFRSVDFTYPGADVPVLKQQSLELAQGEWLAIVGPSGCGKSTLSALACGLLLPDAGEIFLSGRPLKQIPEAELRQRVTVIGQRPALFNDTIAANLRIAKLEASDEELWAALKAAALDQRIARQSEGLQVVLGEGGLGLSGGEQRRLGLARAYLTAPDLFILDEMTEGLDAETAESVLDGFAAFRGSAAVLMIAHKDVEIARAERILRFPTA